MTEIFNRLLQWYTPAELLEMSGPNYLSAGFNQRLEYGILAERIFLIALELGIIENNGFEHLFIVFHKDLSKPERDLLVEDNARNGDVKFINKFSKEKEHIDVKATNFIASHSLSRFRPDGWYMLNAMMISDAKFYYLVRNNQAFRDAVTEKGAATLSKRGDVVGYNVDFDKHLNKAYHPGLEFYEMDPNKYRKFIGEFRIWLSDLGINNLLKKY